MWQSYTFHIHTFLIDIYSIQIIYKHSISVQHNITNITTQHHTCAFFMYTAQRFTALPLLITHCHFAALYEFLRKSDSAEIGVYPHDEPTSLCGLDI